MSKFTEIKERFMGKLQKNSNGCWVWRGSFRKGIPYFWFQGHSQNARRVSWLIEHPHEVIPAGYTYVPTCGSEKCVNPEHLERRFRPYMFSRVVSPDPLYFYEDEKPFKRARPGPKPKRG